MESDVLPCYVVCDVSFSMTDHLDELNAGLREFRGAVHADPAAAARVRVCVVGFAEQPTMLQPLRPATELSDVADPVTSTGTNFGPAFAFLREAIDRDVRLLKRDRLAVRRPIVFFTSDGQPTDPVTWPAAFAALTDPAWTTRPHMVAFGLGDADRSTLDRIGTRRLFLGRDGIRLGTALTVSITLGPRSDHV
ncbi:hypothetical protein BLA60_10115 [Actinophytocola xinjiangensis]|uniref:von Willebrand factor type A domain-containing protein n=1 Tax=Actinophytocola xinjiangensis TaxID=485602 RepID=A0A7Z0WQM0_9PSEU|nr:hypothetical protein [Actinophytocola xinjiangensis]OLF12317.1 hypothetical protein BLA60_10115 [Actinophytocola xinjiangensis]